MTDVSPHRRVKGMTADRADIPIPPVAAHPTDPRDAVIPVGTAAAEQTALIRQALWLAADTRIIDIAQAMHMTLGDASEFRSRCWNLHEAMGTP
jgi:hypothetical protein